MITTERIEKAKALAAAHPGKASRIILDLCAEVERLRKYALRTGRHPVSVTDPWPYHPHLGTQICDLDDDFLRGWIAERRREVLLHDWGLGVIARRDLSLFELITRHLKTNEHDTNVQQQESALADSEIPAGRTQL